MLSVKLKILGCDTVPSSPRRIPHALPDHEGEGTVILGDGGTAQPTTWCHIQETGIFSHLVSHVQTFNTIIRDVNVFALTG